MLAKQQGLLVLGSEGQLTEFLGYKVTTQGVGLTNFFFSSRQQWPVLTLAGQQRPPVDLTNFSLAVRLPA